MRRAIQEPEAFKLGEMVRKKKSFRKQQQQRDRIRFISSLSLSLFSQVDCPCFRQIHHVSDAPYILPFDRFGHPNIFFLCFFSPCFLTDNWDRLSSLSFCVLEVLNPVCLVRTAFPPPLFSLSPPLHYIFYLLLTLFWLFICANTSRPIQQPGLYGAAASSCSSLSIARALYRRKEDAG